MLGYLKIQIDHLCLAKKLSWLYISAAALAALILRSLFRSYRYNSLARRNGCEPVKKYPQVDPIFGFDVFVKQGKMFAENTFLGKTAEEHRLMSPSFSTSVLGTKTIHSIDLDSIRNVFLDNATNWGISYRQAALDPIFGKGVITTDGTEWQRSKQLFAHGLGRANIKDHEAFDHCFSLLTKQIPRDGSTVDLQELNFSLYLDLTTLFIFGESFESLSQGLSTSAQSFIQAQHKCFEGGGLRVGLSPLVFLHHDSCWYAANKLNHKFVEKYVDKVLARKHAQDPVEKRAGRAQLFDFMAEQTEDRTQLRNEALHMYMAVHETTACLISNIFWTLARRKDVWDKLRAEALAIGNADIDFDSGLRMPCLQNVISDSLRIRPVFPWHVREAATECILPSGGGHDGETPVFCEVWTRFDCKFAIVHLSKEIWGVDAAEFKPERWEDFRPSAVEVLAWGAGMRTCMGKQKAIMETSYYVMKMLREFKAAEARDDRPWKGLVQILAKNLHGTKVAFTPA